MKGMCFSAIWDCYGMKVNSCGHLVLNGDRRQYNIHGNVPVYEKFSWFLFVHFF